MKNFDLAMSAIQDASEYLYDEQKTAIDDAMPLLRAAPKLLAALQRLTNEAESRGAVPKAEIRLAREIINKAKGV